MDEENTKVFNDIVNDFNHPEEEKVEYDYFEDNYDEEFKKPNVRKSKANVGGSRHHKTLNSEFITEEDLENILLE